MKKNIILLLLLMTSLTISATKPVIIQGKWNREGNDVSLYKIISGRLEVVSTYILEEDRSFGFLISPKEESFYVLGTGNPQARTDKYLFYFKPGDNLNVEFIKESYQLVGENNAENKIIENWHNKIEPLEKMSVYFMFTNNTYVDFFPLLDEFIESNYSFPSSGNPIFDASFDKMAQFGLLNIALNFIFTPRTAHPHVDDYPDYYREIDVSELTKDGSLLEFPFGSMIINQLLFIENLLSEKGQPSVDDALKLLVDRSIKGEYILNLAKGLKTYAGYKDLIELNEQFLVSQDQIDRAKAIEAKLAVEQNTGETAINFIAKDVGGNDVSLTDFKGKIVLVDAWATWCGPCKTELPHFKKLADEFKSKDVVFMGVSLDEPKDHKKWEEFLSTEKLPGVQLFAGGFSSDFARLYGINAIPRFMLFDKEGKIVSKNAPRPSSDELKVLINSELNK